jgi:hypothetical protein
MSLKIGYAAEPTPTDNSALDDLQNNLQSQLDTIYDHLNNMEQTAAPTPVPPTPTPIIAPKVKLVAPQTVSLTAGRLQDVRLTIKNVGTAQASSFLASVALTGEGVFSMTFIDNSNIVNNIPENAERDMTLRFVTDKTAKPGTYNIELRYSYRDAAGTNHTESDTIIVKVTNSSYGGGIALRDFKTDPAVILPGTAFELSVTLANTGAVEVTNLQIALDGLKSDGISLTGDGNVYRSLFSWGSEEKLVFKMIAARKAAGSYPITFNITAKNPDGEKVETTFSYYVNINAGDLIAAEPPVIEIVSLTEPGGVYGVGEKFSFTLSLANNGGSTAKNVKIIADGGDTVVPMSANTRLIGSLAAGDTQNVSFLFAATADAKTQNYSIHFTLTYQTGSSVYPGSDSSETDGSSTEDSSPETITIEQYAGVNISNPPIPTETPIPDPESIKISKPKIIISSYKTEPGIVSAGKEFILTLDFKNTHKEKSINNIKIVLEALETTNEKGSVFSPVNCSNTVFIDQIAPSDVVTHTLTMFTVPDATPRTYTLSCKYNYQDDDYNDYTEEEQIGVSVKQIIKLETGQITVPPEGIVGEPVSLYFNIVNSGRVTLNNLRVTVDADMDVSGANMFMGKLAVSGSAYYDGTMIPTTPGSTKGKIIISGEDDTGELLELTHDFSMTVSDFSFTEEEFPIDDQFIEEEPSGFFGHIIMNPLVWIIGVIILVAGVAAFIILKRKRRQKSWSQDE